MPNELQQDFMQPAVERETPKRKEKGTGRLIVGIISVVLSVMVLMQSCTVAGLGALVSEDAFTSGFGGMLIAFSMLIAGVVDMATRKSPGKAGSVVSIVFYALAALIGVVFAADFPDLGMYAGLCLVFGLVDVVILVKRRKSL